MLKNAIVLSLLASLSRGASAAEPQQPQQEAVQHPFPSSHALHARQRPTPLESEKPVEVPLAIHLPTEMEPYRSVYFCERGIGCANRQDAIVYVSDKFCEDLKKKEMVHFFPKLSHLSNGGKK